jgi:multidrug efflux pump subunit AcrB
MLASYLLSRTLVPTLARMLLVHESHEPQAHGFNAWRDRHFERFQNAYGRMLALLLARRGFTVTVASILAVISLGLVFVVGTDFFPSVDSGLMKLHFRAPAGTRIEETEKLVMQIEKKVHEIVPADELETLNAMLGLPTSYNLGFVQTDNIGPMDAEILIALKEHHHPTEGYMRKIRVMLAQDFPGSSAYFQPADIVSQVLNFGLSAPIDVQVEGANFAQSGPIAQRVREEMRAIPGIADVHILQVLDYPTLKVDVDRLRAAQVGLSQRDVANNILISLSSSGLVSPSYFLNPANNVNYTVVVKTPLTQVSSTQALMNTPMTVQGATADSTSPLEVPQAQAQTLGSLAELSSQYSPDQINHYTVQRVLDVQAGMEGRDLGSIVSDMEKRFAKITPLPKGVKITIRGQNQVMSESFRSLGLGLILAIALVYCLMVVLFQSWLDPLIIMVAVPGALVGILWMLAVTHTTLNVESMMGSIMAVGIAVSNSILLVNFANDLRVEKNLNALDAALEAGKTRLRPVIMTALAMIIGMVPMALALGEAGEQNAPLGRAVIGGLLMATFVTLFVVPVVYSLLRTKLPTKHLLEERFIKEKNGEDPLQAKHEVEAV